MSVPNLCPFCSLPRERIVLQLSEALVIRDRFPVSQGHTLIIPRRHIGSFFESSAGERTQILSLLDAAKLQLDNEFKPAGYNVAINDGEAAGQTVMHLHIHLIPRYTGDCFDPRGGIRWIFPDKADYWSGQE